MKVEVIDRLIFEDMRSNGKTMEEILKSIPKRRRKEFQRNVKPKFPWAWKIFKVFK